MFDENSEVRQRIVEYGKLVDELHIIVFSTRKSEGQSTKLETNVFLYPTYSRNRWFYIFDALKIGEKILASGGQWLITAQDPFECGLAAWLIKRKFKILLQIQIHTDFLSPYFRKEFLLNCIRFLIAKFLISRADCIRAVSKRIKKSIISGCKFQASKITILPIFVDVRKIQETAIKTDLHQKYPQFDFIILMASRLTREKNISLAIKAMKEITKRRPRAGLIVAGEGPERETLKSQIKNRKLQKNVILEPWNNDLFSYYKTADLFLLTSNYEGYGMAVVEAMAAGCPVVMTDVGLAGEVLIDKKDGLVVPVGNKEKLIESIRSLIDENSGLRTRLIENAKKTLDFWPVKEQYMKNYQDAWRLCGKDRF